MAAAENSSVIRHVDTYLDEINSEARLELNYDCIILLSDRKGSYLQRQIDVYSEYADTSKLTFWFRGGRKTSAGVSFLREKVDQTLRVVLEALHEQFRSCCSLQGCIGSMLFNYLEQNEVGVLLGDSGYPLRRYLLTPKLNPRAQEEAFTTCQSKGRMVIEKVFGILMSRFR